MKEMMMTAISASTCSPRTN